MTENILDGFKVIISRIICLGIFFDNKEKTTGLLNYTEESDRENSGMHHLRGVPDGRAQDLLKGLHLT